MTCNTCNDKYYGFPACKSCQCNSVGSLNLNCNSNGKCSCKSGYTSDKCNQCASGYFKEKSGRCTGNVTFVLLWSMSERSERGDHSLLWGKSPPFEVLLLRYKGPKTSKISAIGGGARETYSESLPSIGSSARLIEEYSRGVGVEEER